MSLKSIYRRIQGSLGHNKFGIYRLLISALIIFLVIYSSMECFYQKIFHIPCLGCGMTRAWKYFVRGDINEAYEFHKGFWTAPIIALYIYKGKFLFRRIAWDILLILLLFFIFIYNYFIIYFSN